MSNPEPSAPAPSLAERLSVVQVGVREDLDVTRHLVRGQPEYVICDPMTFQSHRLNARDYAVFVSIDASRKLGDVFADLVERGIATPETEESFYRFVFSLHAFNFLHLPKSDDKLLYQRHVLRKKARHREKLLGFLFLRIPLINPDKFLERTVKYVRPVFTRWCFALWIALLASAIYITVRNWEQLVRPVEGVLLARNLPLLWAVLIGLKLLHEFGHAYACKHYGGYVPEMGAYMIIFTPCAYVDASASWAFTRKRERIIVSLAGMYVELFFASLAAIVWASSPPGLVRDIAYNTMFLAGIVTILFNINPLMRYDGYYVFSDLVEVPNLRQRSTKMALSVLKRVFLGLGDGLAPLATRLGMLLFCFGIAASIYRTIIMVGIAALIASKLLFAGLVLAVFFLGKTFLSTFRRLCSFLWFAKETAPVRARAVALSIILILVIPGAILFIPVRSDIIAAGVLGRETETIIRARVGGIVTRVPVPLGQRVSPGDVLVELVDDEVAEAVASAATKVEASEIRHSAFLVDNPAMAMQEQEQARVYGMELDRRERDLADLVLRADAEAIVLNCLRERDLGRYVHAGEPVATIGGGDWTVRAVLDENQVTAAHLSVGEPVEIRTSAAPGSTLRGVIQRIAPAGSRTVYDESLTLAGGGEIAVDPMTGETAQPYFEITITLDDPSPRHLCHGMTCKLRFRSTASPLGRTLMRRAVRLIDTLSQG